MRLALDVEVLEVDAAELPGAGRPCSSSPQAPQWMLPGPSYAAPLPQERLPLCAREQVALHLKAMGTRDLQPRPTTAPRTFQVGRRHTEEQHS